MRDHTNDITTRQTFPRQHAVNNAKRTMRNILDTQPLLGFGCHMQREEKAEKVQGIEIKRERWYMWYRTFQLGGSYGTLVRESRKLPKSQWYNIQ